MLRVPVLFAAAAAALLLAPTNAAAQLIACNKTSIDAVWVAYGYEDETHGWTARGWWEVKKGTCETLIPIALEERYYYVYGEGGGRTWQAEDDDEGAYFCVSRDPFTLYDKDFTSNDNVPDCEARGFVTKKFDEIDTEDYDEYTWTLSD